MRPAVGTTRHRRTVLAIGIIVIAAFAIGGALRPMVRRSRQADLQGAAVRTGVATVVVRYGWQPTVGGGDDHPWAMVRFNGRLYASQTARHIEQLHEGGEARITYRIGKSGRIYVDSAEPL